MLNYPKLELHDDLFGECHPRKFQYYRTELLPAT